MLLAQVAVNNVRCYEKRFRLEFEEDLQTEEPVDKAFPVVSRDVLLESWSQIVLHW